MRYRFIESEKAKGLNISVAVLCEALEVSRSGFYAWQTRQTAPPSKRAHKTEQLRKTIRSLQLEEGRGTYGRPRILTRLRELGHAIGANRVRRIMLQEGLYGRPRRRWKARADKGLPPAENLLERNFTATAANQVWCGDITEFKIGNRKLFVAVVIDLFSRRVVGLAFSTNANTALVVRTLLDALARRQPQQPVIFHTDRGVQYRSALFRAIAAANNVVQSMSRAYNCLDNAVAESFFATLEHELASRRNWTSIEQAEHDLRDFILGFYNPTRIHTTNGNMSPEAFEALAA